MSKQIKTAVLFLFCIFALVGGGKFYMDRLKVDNLYRHGFQLYEEQIATYLKEHYSGISKIEFSPIFKSGGRGEGFVHARIVPVVYDNYGNKVYLRNDGTINTLVPNYVLTSGIELDFNVNDGSEIIYLYNEKNESVKVGQHQHLPEQLKLQTYKSTDAIIAAYSQKEALKGVEKNNQGSPKVKIVYNLEIKRVDEREVGKWK
ncbi:hypothetical protein ACVRXQ_13285 [Streptococcus panodentis]|uniref:Uncharacterized protein n=1 Tax=Streptococcus panodentis TaxID=1581472 RepID=A0ABS5B0F6_9STRE|nr:hypothetical protein [Streptococcus panodentis]MBP2622304.1 hypothetical protein [Streptococcus panodentis]